MLLVPLCLLMPEEKITEYVKISCGKHADTVLYMVRISTGRNIAKVAELKQRLNGLTKAKGTIDKTMTQLVQDSEFKKFLEKKIHEVNNG